MLNLMWFKTDLRVLDNPALHAAMTSGSTIAVYFISETQWALHGVSLAKISLIKRQLKLLETELAQLNVPLIVKNTDCFKTLPVDLINFTKSIGVNKIFCNQEYELNENLCEQKVAKLAYEQHYTFNSYNDTCLSEPGVIKNNQGQSYKVFSAFKRAFLKDTVRILRPLIPRNKPQAIIDIPSDISILASIENQKYSDHFSHEDLWPAGENEAHNRLEQFGEEAIFEYASDRDIPSKDGTSTLSPYLVVGALSTRQCLQLAVQKNKNSFDESKNGASTWINELLWREFYRHLLSANPKLCKFKPFKEETDKLPWRHDLDMFEAWKNGTTGYPIVDAAMRQLKETAWMHNRLRMVTAMFLTKHLFIDWRWGEAYFMSMLVDGDFASNNGGWQWSASTGVDAVPYFRIFNPTRQSQRFDPSGNFIRRYLPELECLDNKSIHKPSYDQVLQTGYYLPLVDHKNATEQTKSYFKQLKNSPYSMPPSGEHHYSVSSVIDEKNQQEFMLE